MGLETACTPELPTKTDWNSARKETGLAHQFLGPQTEGTPYWLLTTGTDNFFPCQVTLGDRFDLSDRGDVLKLRPQSAAAGHTLRIGHQPATHRGHGVALGIRFGSNHPAMPKNM